MGEPLVGMLDGNSGECVADLNADLLEKNQKRQKEGYEVTQFHTTT